jgi:hypothetical protein
MTPMVPILSVLLIVSLSILVTRVAAVALVHTGLSRESARFQARSAFSGVGFTTTEAEAIVTHPVRRRIVMWLMLVGNVGLVTAISSVLLSFVNLGGGGDWRFQLGVLVAGVGLLAWLAWSPRVDRLLCSWISRALNRWTSIDARDYARLLHVQQDYGVSEVRIEAGDWLEGKTLRGTALASEGVTVLGIQRPDGHFVGVPGANSAIGPGDTLILYGRTPRIAELDRRHAGAEGDAAHTSAIEEERGLER